MHDLSDITIVTVAYNSAEPLRGMLQTVPPETDVVVVDNGSSDRSPLDAVVADFDNARLVEATQNLGFGRACNLGAEDAKTEFLLFLNPDTRLANDTLDAFLMAAQVFPDAGAFNPKLVDDNGRVRYKRHNKLLPRSRKMPRGMPAAPFEVCVIVGAAIFVSQVNFAAVGGFDPNIFLYFEDDDLAVRIEKSCGSLMIVPDAVVTHARGGSSLGDEDMSPFKYWHFGYARVYTTLKHGRPFARTSALWTALRKLLNPSVMTVNGQWAGRIAHFKGTVAAISGRRATKDSGL